MNISYFRKSNFDLKTTQQNIVKESQKLGLEIMGQTTLSNKQGIVFHIANPTWLGNLIASDQNLIGLLPSSIVVLAKDNDILVGVGSTTLLSKATNNPAITQISQEVEKTLKDLVHNSSGIGPLKPVEIKLYSTLSCPYCKMESAWLKDKSIDFSEVHVDLDQKEAEEMVAKTGQMGVPVTVVKYDNGDEEFVVGFDRPKLSQILEVN